MTSNNLSWKQLNQYLQRMNEDEVYLLLQEEIEHKRRPTYLERLHQRYNSLRVMRERYELKELVAGK